MTGPGDPSTANKLSDVGWNSIFWIVSPATATVSSGKLSTTFYILVILLNVWGLVKNLLRLVWVCSALLSKLKRVQNNINVNSTSCSRDSNVECDRLMQRPHELDLLPTSQHPMMDLYSRSSGSVKWLEWNLWCWWFLSTLISPKWKILKVRTCWIWLPYLGCKNWLVKALQIREEFKWIPGDSRGMVFNKSPDSVDQILQVKSSEVDTRYFSSTSGWKAIEFTLSLCPPNSCRRNLYHYF